MVVRVNNARNSSVATVSQIKRKLPAQFVGKIGVKECADPGPPALGNGNEDSVAAGKLAGAAAEVPSHSGINLVAVRCRSSVRDKRCFSPSPLATGAPPLLCQIGPIGYIYFLSYFRGRTGFDLKFEAQAACRGWFVGLVKNRAKKNKRRSPRSRSRGLIDRDVWSWTPATAPNVDSRLIVRRSDRVGR